LLLTPERPKKINQFTIVLLVGGKIGYVDGGDISSTDQFVD